MLGETVSNIKEDRTDLDLLYACLLDWGVEINLPHTSAQVAGCTVHNVDNGALAACFDKTVPRAVVEYMANCSRCGRCSATAPLPPTRKRST